MTNTDWDLGKDITSIRNEFPILERCTYLISNSLGAVPRKAHQGLERYYSLWAEQGVSAWANEWWNLSRKLGDQIASFIGAEEDQVVMMTSATHCHWVALSTKFKAKEEKRQKIIMTDQDFPSTIYAVSKIAEVMGWKIDLVKNKGKPGIALEEILSRIDENTLFVATSHVYFKSAYVQDIRQIAQRAHQAGAITLIDGYHAPGTIPVDLKQLEVDFYVGGCLKWLCGGPGCAFLYVRPELASSLEPQLTGWLAHSSPFSFSPEMEFAQGSYRFMSGTPPIPCLYTASAGLDIINKVGISQIREKSLRQTGLIIERSEERNFPLFTPREKAQRGGAVSVAFPHAFQVKQALEEREIKVDFRKGIDNAPDIIRIGPHFYTTDKEIESLFQQVDAIYTSGEFKKYPVEIKSVT